MVIEKKINKTLQKPNSVTTFIQMKDYLKQ